jgi:cytochrome b
MIPGPQDHTLENFAARASTESLAAEQAVERLRVKVWDLPVRITHWLLVLAFVGAYVTNRLGVAYFKYHEWFGYTVIVLVVFRIFWGLWGTFHARFSNFLKSPVATWRYTAELLRQRDKPSLGHNPLGALMVLLLLLTLLIQAVTGLFANDEIFNAGALYGYVSNDVSLTLTALHKELFYWIAAAVAVHILAVLVHVFLKNENLVSAMFTGYKSGAFLQGPQTMEKSYWLRAAILVALVAAVLFVLISLAPNASLDSDY